MVATIAWLIGVSVRGSREIMVKCRVRQHENTITRKHDMAIPWKYPENLACGLPWQGSEREFAAKKPQISAQKAGEMTTYGH
ncbi:MAG: hypothetical protein [Inoviridae sp.]|nr:MAG: hypothetical protein [Inoviridae sp.]